MLATLLAAFMFFGFAGFASAQEINVNYGGGPLFSEADFLPGDAEVKSFTVENLSGASKEVRLRTINESDTGLAEAITVSIERTPDTEYFNDTLKDLFDQSFVSLGTVNDGSTVTYTVRATFLPSAGNGYQGGEAGFAFCVGFAGDNENCVTDTNPDSPDDDTNDDDDGGNNKKISYTSDPEPDPDDGPDGRVEGESTSTSQTATIFNNPITTDFIDFVRGSVLGEMATATTSTSTMQNIDGNDDPKVIDELPSGIALATGMFDNCTFVWLLLLILISLSWSLFADKLGKQASVLGVFFTRNLIFSVVYVLLLSLGLYFGLLDTVWFIFAGAWAIMTGIDYYFHKLTAEVWNGHSRNIYFAGAGLLLAVLGFATPLVCVWVPFAAIALISTLLLFLDI